MPGWATKLGSRNIKQAATPLPLQRLTESASALGPRIGTQGERREISNDTDHDDHTGPWSTPHSRARTCSFFPRVGFYLCSVSTISIIVITTMTTTALAGCAAR